MASFRGLTADRRPVDSFKISMTKAAKVQNVSPSGVDLHLFEWSENDAYGHEKSNLRSIADLEAQSEGGVRVIFAPQDVPRPDTTTGLVELFETCGIPSAFIDEGLRSVSQSFAAQEDLDGTTFIWFHLLCKTLAIKENQIDSTQYPENAKEGGNNIRRRAQCLSQADFSWLKPGFVLKIRRQQSKPLRPARTRTSSTDDTLAATSTRAKVDLYCFGAPNTLLDRFKTLKNMATYEDLIEDPCLFLEIVFEEVYKVMDWTEWAISDKFGPSETQTLEMASRPGKATEELLNDHFTGLHNLAKHTIYLRENCEAALATLADLCSYHKAVVGDNPSASQKLTRQALKYRKTLFESTQRRLSSLDARMTNIIQLSFHIVTQGDSRVMQSESQSMKTIAVMTLLFMPLGTVASIFGSQFMKLQDEKPYRITVSQDFWLLWVIAVPLTIVVLGIWRVWYMEARGRLIDGLEKPSKGGNNYMGWRTLPETLHKERMKRAERKASVWRKMVSGV